MYPAGGMFDAFVFVEAIVKGCDGRGEDECEECQSDRINSTRHYSENGWKYYESVSDRGSGGIARVSQPFAHRRKGMGVAQSTISTCLSYRNFGKA